MNREEIEQLKHDRDILRGSRNAFIEENKELKEKLITSNALYENSKAMVRDKNAEIERYREALKISHKAFWNILEDADNSDAVKQISNSMYNHLTETREALEDKK